jgi:hypothetical protein
MVGFIHDNHVPSRVESFFCALLILRKQFDAAQDQLGFEERVVVAGGLAAFFVVDVEPEVEAPQQFHEPLVHQGFRYQNQHALCPPGQNQPVEDEAGFNGFSQADFVRKEHSGCEPCGDFGRNVKLVRNQIDAATQETAYF